MFVIDSVGLNKGMLWLASVYIFTKSKYKIQIQMEWIWMSNPKRPRSFLKYLQIILFVYKTSHNGVHLKCLIPNIKKTVK